MPDDLGKDHPLVAKRKLSRGDAAQFQEIVDEPGFQFDIPADQRQFIVRRLRQAGISFQRRHRHQNRCQGRSQLVAESRKKTVFESIRGFSRFFRCL